MNGRRENNCLAKVNNGHCHIIRDQSPGMLAKCGKNTVNVRLVWSIMLLPLFCIWMWESCIQSALLLPLFCQSLFCQSLFCHCFVCVRLFCPCHCFVLVIVLVDVIVVLNILLLFCHIWVIIIAIFLFLSFLSSLQEYSHSCIIVVWPLLELIYIGGHGIAVMQTSFCFS